jgi:flagellar biosynthesis activator protein FlaF
MALQAYQTASARTESPRELEYRLFGFVTGELMRAKAEGRADLSKFAEAIDRNRRMWSAFAVDCSGEGNELPKELRASIMSLSMWVSRYSSDVIQDGAEIDALIEINKSVMQGLAPQQSAG